MSDPDPLLDDLFARLRTEPPSAIVTATARNLPGRVAARLCAAAPAEVPTWSWRLSAAFSVPTLAVLVWAGVAAFGLSQNVLALPDSAAWLLNLGL